MSRLTVLFVTFLLLSSCTLSSVKDQEMRGMMKPTATTVTSSSAPDSEVKISDKCKDLANSGTKPVVSAKCR